MPIADTIPKEGATGWADTWLLATNAPHPNCAYKWMQWVTTPKVQAEEAIYFGETPANTLACPIMNQLQKGGCAAYHANAPGVLLLHHQVLEDPAVDLRQRPERLRRLHAVATGLDADPGLVDARVGRQRTRQRAGAALWRRPWLRGALTFPRPSHGSS